MDPSHDRPGHWSRRISKGGPFWLLSRNGPVYDPLSFLPAAQAVSAPPWVAFTREAASKLKAQRRLDAAHRLHSASSNRSTLGGITTYPGGITMIDVSHKMSPSDWEKYLEPMKRQSSVN
jgi:hypothetical protein